MIPHRGEAQCHWTGTCGQSLRGSIHAKLHTYGNSQECRYSDRQLVCGANSSWYRRSVRWLETQAFCPLQPGDFMSIFTNVTEYPSHKCGIMERRGNLMG